MKKVYTQIPICSLGQTPSGIKDCAVCEYGTKYEIRPINVAESFPIPVSATIDKTTVYAGDPVTITIEFDNYVDLDDISTKLSAGLDIESIEKITNKIIQVTVNTDVDNLGNKNIGIIYEYIARYFNINVIESYPKILEIKCSPERIRQGENTIVKIILNRELKHNEEFPSIIINTEAFEIIEEFETMNIAPTVIRGVLSAKLIGGDFEVGAKFPDSTIVTTPLIIESPERIIWATEEDIDGLFPEISEEDNTPEIPEDSPIVSSVKARPMMFSAQRAVTPKEENNDGTVWATEEDIDGLFPELFGEK